MNNKNRDKNIRGSNGRKNKNIDAWQIVTGSYVKKQCIDHQHPGVFKDFNFGTTGSIFSKSSCLEFSGGSVLRQACG